MLKEELRDLIANIQASKCEGQTIEVKASHGGFPKIYDTLSSFSNQDAGGTIIFGVDENNNFDVVGVYNPQDLLHKIAEQCKQMEPNIKVTTTECNIDGKTVISAEVPAREIYDRPVYYKGAGILKGSYSRIGDSDELMTDYEVYSYEAYKQHKQDDSRLCTNDSAKYIDTNLLAEYINKVRHNKPNTQALSDEQLLELMGLYKQGTPTLTCVMCFSKYPQAFYPQLCITAIVVPGNKIGDCDELNNRFIDNKKIEGTIPEMLTSALNFVSRNMKTSVIIKDGTRLDTTEYPITAIREALLNALVHRDYSIHSEGMPIRLEMYNDRLEIINAGGLYGAITIDELGRIHADTRNKTLIATLETMNQVENRYSGIPTIRKQMQEAGLREPIFINKRGLFKVVFYNKTNTATSSSETELNNLILKYCTTPRSKSEISALLNKTPYYANKVYIEPLIKKGLLAYTIPEKPQSKYQKVYTCNK